MLSRKVKKCDPMLNVLMAIFQQTLSYFCKLVYLKKIVGRHPRESIFFSNFKTAKYHIVSLHIKH